ncbi:MAG: hypothetical protein ACC661_13085 [Verrucomicrobiales bacterium]
MGSRSRLSSGHKGFPCFSPVLAALVALVSLAEAGAQPRAASRGGGGLDSGFGPSRLGREAGAIYFEEILDQPLKLKVLRETKVYLQLNGQRAVGTLIPGREVELLAMSDKAYRVRGRARHDQGAGWVRPADLEGMTENLKENLKKLYARQVLVEDLIAKKQVALGMTIGEVERSMGAPTEASSRLDKDGRRDSYAYITYKNVPQYHTTYGNDDEIFTGWTYIKVEVGRITIEFEDEMVVSIAEKEGAPGGSTIRTVPAPVILY